MNMQNNTGNSFRTPEGVLVTYRYIDPIEAANLLVRNEANRNLRKHHVTAIASDMASGRFRFNGSPIVISKTGRLLDGQHRLQALIKAGTAIPFLVISYADDSIVEAIDTGAKRTLADMFYFKFGTKYRTEAAALTRRLMAYRDNRGKTYWDGTNQARNYSNGQLSDYYEANRERIDGAIEETQRYARESRFVTRGVLQICYALFKDIDQSLATWFFEALATGVGLKAHDPILLLRKLLINAQSATKSYSPEMEAAYIIKTWNAIIEARPLVRLSYRPGGGNAESFPLISTRPAEFVLQPEPMQ